MINTVILMQECETCHYRHIDEEFLPIVATSIVGWWLECTKCTHLQLLISDPYKKRFREIEKLKDEIKKERDQLLHKDYLKYSEYE